MIRSIILCFVLLFTVVNTSEPSDSASARYATACPGAFDVVGSVYNSFYNVNFHNETSLMNECSIDYFTSIPSECNANQTKCAKAVQQFMWNRCHWRLLSNVRDNITTVVNSIRKDDVEIYEFINAMAKNDAIYDLASKCASWNWIAIAIMVVVAFVGSYIAILIVGGIMKLTMKKPQKIE